MKNRFGGGPREKGDTLSRREREELNRSKKGKREKTSEELSKEAERELARRRDSKKNKIAASRANNKKAREIIRK